MEQLNRDELFSLAISLELPELLKFCATSKKISNIVCKTDPIWNYKLNKDFPEWSTKTSFVSEMKGKSLKEIYTVLYQLSRLKKKLDLIPDIYTLYGRHILNFNNREILEMPREIGVLKNLETLYFSGNKLKTLPKEIGNLVNLQFLYLQKNELISIPEEIGNLSKLSVLYLSGNQLQTLPLSIINMPNLKLLTLNNNPLTYLSSEIRDLPFIRF